MPYYSTTCTAHWTNSDECSCTTSAATTDYEYCWGGWVTETTTNSFTELIWSLSGSGCAGERVVVRKQARGSSAGWSEESNYSLHSEKKGRQVEYDRLFAQAKEEHEKGLHANALNNVHRALSYMPRSKEAEELAKILLPLVRLANYRAHHERAARARERNEFMTVLSEVGLARGYANCYQLDIPADDPITAEMNQWYTEAEVRQEEIVAERQRKVEESKRKRAIAAKRAEALLLMLLSPEQREEYKAHKYVTVVGSSGGKFRVKLGWAGNVFELSDKDIEARRFCIHPTVECPEEDNVLLQLLMIKTDEEEFRKVANKTILDSTLTVELDRRRSERLAALTQPHEPENVTAG